MTETTFEPIVTVVQKLDVKDGDIVCLTFKGFVGKALLDEMTERLNTLYPQIQFLVLSTPYQMEVDMTILHPTESKND